MKELKICVKSDFTKINKYLITYNLTDGGNNRHCLYNLHVHICTREFLKISHGLLFYYPYFISLTQDLVECIFQCRVVTCID